MKLGLRLFLGFFLVVGLAAYAVLSIFAEEVKPGVRQGMEVTLADTAHLLAEVAATDLAAGSLEGGRLATAVARYQRRDLGARIWGLEHRQPMLRVTVTDAQGRVQYDSQGLAPGQDLSTWNDVLRTLRGEYGARTSRLDPADPSSSSMHVAAPVRLDGRLAGVLTVVAPTASLHPYAERSRRKVLQAGAVLLGSALLVGVLLTGWLGRSVARLKAYAGSVAEGRPATLPSLGGELAELGRALESMRIQLEGRQYVERYVQHLTHEMKSPLAAIRGAAELLGEPMPEADRERFLANILDQEARLRRLIERMLALATLEHRQSLQDPGPVGLQAILDKVLGALEPSLAKKRVRIRREGLADLEVFGEAFLLEQALRNLLENAVAFSPPDGTVRITLEAAQGRGRVRIRDAGPGLPDWARERLFTPFFSLPGPGDAKGTGLGLSFVREVAKLHQGVVSLDNHPEGGAEARLELPLG